MQDDNFLDKSNEKNHVPMVLGASGIKSYKLTLLSKCTELHSTSGVY